MSSLSLGCASGAHGHAHASVGSAHGESAPVETTKESTPEQKPGTSPKTTERDGHPTTTAQSEEVETAPEGDGVEPHPDIEAARAALHRVQQTDNHLGLVFALAERASDLPWVLAIENRSNHDVRLATLPAVIQFEVLAPNSGDEKQPSKPIVCGETAPRRLAADETKVLPAGGLLVHAFDPRTLCDDEEVLQKGATVRVRYGFPLQTKKLWRKGKLTEVEVAQKAPFVAERVETGDDPVQRLKHLNAASFTLGRTYPLSAVEARPASNEGSDQVDEPSTPVASTAEYRAPPPPVEVKIYPLGKSKTPERGLVRVQVKNVSSRSLLVHLRREAFRYEVVGPTGSHTCRMMPSELSATRLSYSTIAPSASRSLSTRLAEACPKGVWDLPGTYSVAVRFQPTSEGEEKRDGAFVGSVEGANIATLTVPGPVPQSMAQMLIVLD